ncbi:MAG: hypothetical protein HY917_02165, partial [Candidatus Diapherotrites archaeon]|nr:hypothetical protein [Candidatus Diapherotrites archaeon]
FQSYLMKDGFTSDFKKDFVQYYTQEDFANTPSWFMTDSGTDFALKRLLENDNLFITRKYATSEDRLSSPGLYEVELAAYFGDNWKFFNADGTPAVSFGVVLYKVKDPVPENPFYYLPFDGLVGLQGNGYSRQGYGTAYVNYNAEQEVFITDPASGVMRSFPDNGSNPAIFVQATKASDPRALNSILSERGVLLRVNRNADEADIRLSPNYPTPVLMKVSQAAASDDPVSAYYTMLYDSTPVVTGGVLTYWKGAGRCADFTGIPVQEKFNYSPDRKTTSADRGTSTDSAESAYALDWSNGSNPGSLYLQTIFYTPNGQHAAIKASSANTQFASNGQNYDSSLDLGSNAYSADPVSSIQKVFELMRNEEVCMTASGTQATFWWNPKPVYEQSIQGQVAQLDYQNQNPQSQCIGPR